MNRFSAILVIILCAALSSCAALRNTSAPGYRSGSPEAEGYTPKGKVEVKVCPSSEVGLESRRMVVYLPEAYFKDDTTSFPVIYLLHGARGYETSWITKGEVLQICDSLFTSGQAVPAIVVMPNMNQYNDADDYDSSRRKGPFESILEIDGTVESAFCRDVLPFIDSTYRTIPSKEGRAIAGLSIGGMQSIFISAANPDKFDYIGAYSPAWKAIFKHGKDSSFYKHLNDKLAEQFADDPPEGYYMLTGRTDIYVLPTVASHAIMNKKGYDCDLIISPGGHSWRNWSDYLAYSMQHFFKDE